jgi:hypothetical protein
MSKAREMRLIPLAVIAAFTLLLSVTLSVAQEPVSPLTDVESWTGGTIDDALFQSAAGTTIPMSAYTIEGVGVKGGGSYHGVIVGPSFLDVNPQPVTIQAVFIPLIIEIVSPNGTLTKFDPTEPNNCDGGYSAEYRFRNSPLVVASPLAATFNGVSVGNLQYINGFMRAQFWRLNGQSPGYSIPLSWSFASAVTLPVLGPGFAIVKGTDSCPQGGTVSQEQGFVSQAQFNFFMKSLIIPSLQASGVISPTKFAFFLTKNVETAKTLTPTTAGIFGGQHYATGSPVQTWARAAYTVGGDVKAASHEIGEWMNDPLVSTTFNRTPPWGGEGEFPNGCSSSLEVGDPVNGKNMPLIFMNGHNYHVQELAYFWWFFNARLFPSFGLGGFSGNGTFQGPAKACLKGFPPKGPGGTY